MSDISDNVDVSDLLDGFCPQRVLGGVLNCSLEASQESCYAEGTHLEVRYTILSLVYGEVILGVMPPLVILGDFLAH